MKGSDLPKVSEEPSEDKLQQEPPKVLVRLLDWVGVAAWLRSLDVEDKVVELVEKERIIMVLERKTELEKETQAAYVQKEDGADVMSGMKREIHRMQLRYSQLMRRQEELMVEMERAIFKRDAIGLRGKLKQAHAKS